MRIKEKSKAIRLRLKGKSYSEIQKYIPVSNSTLSVWLRSVKLKPEQERRLLKRKLQGAWRGAIKANREKRIKSAKQIITKSWNETSKLIKNPLFLAGLALYWAEGTKSTGGVSFSNSDPQMIKLFTTWLRKICGVPEKKLRVEVHIHSLHSRKNVEEYWSRITGIPLNQFTKTYIKKTSLGYRKNKLYNGTCAVRVHSVDLFRKIVGWKLGLLNYFNIINPNLKERIKIIQSTVDTLPRPKALK